MSQIVVFAKPLWEDGTEGGVDEFAGKELVVIDNEDAPAEIGCFLAELTWKWIGQTDTDDPNNAVRCDAVDVTISRNP